MIIIIIVLLVLYMMSVIGCTIYLIEINVHLNIISLLIAFCPIINTIYAFKCPSVKETIKQLTGKGND